MVEVKGTTILLRMQFVEERATPEQKKAIRERLAPEFSQVLESGMLLPAEWRPLQWLVQLTQVVDQVLGTGDGKLAWELGRYSAELGAKAMYSAFSKPGDPGLIFSIGSGVWRQFYSSGRLEVVNAGPARVRLQVHDFEEPVAEICAGVGGWMERNVELAGTASTEVREVACRRRGDAYCEYDISWT
ncbi:MAG: hypothetical protein K8J08_06690 [Thermoanaerobaculia bacterium]|nr:hypothetical protein [Thermoanaerobaculia bacterium]